ncbi:unnamed protein product [Ceutorhynchus assimilis]|uniref:5'-3' exoribonuclease 1 n=1 Tax=Ceutorhynchus assimilis TaxID=467358 RepID=A0A9P0GKD9_9CUCU|nr:unnamed protein product [Ceutorhynchus assimilis]
MGVPKFFRYMSERYPCLSELIREYQIPEFDNMYLDMNGIIHMCSHPDDNNPHFRITEQKIFEDIFHYLEVLFRMIKPQQLFFMAIDGVAPRAKMNQQRGRRFRSAKDAEKQEIEAQKKGETLPTEARFDSNCITPGTVFMARLQEQLKYFCKKKISTDPLWRNVKVILSGHETPGEGEHKIMDYIRYIRAQPGYNPHTRHCLYGLDADLIMLGLCTHEPHFSLLREEVKFGKQSSKRQSVPEEITFFLLHLSLMREYLELEFAPVKDKLVGFEYDFEKIIDDWVLMGFLVGNDFIPHLPHLHISNGALPILYNAYMEVLPTLDGYINEGGTLNLARFEKFMQKLSAFDTGNFEEIRGDLDWMESKTGRKATAHSQVSTSGPRELETWQAEGADDEDFMKFEALEPESAPAKDSGLAALIQATDELDIESDEDDDEDEDKAFKYYKREYYMNKLEYANVTPQVLRSQAEGYVEAIQWNLHYYYNGVCSWSWYYPHHYAPYISDIKGFADFKFNFDLGTPFKPYEQLLGVLPAASKSLLPEPYHKLMLNDDSLIKQYYPEDFQTDKNGKRQEWEAVVLIPFMDEKLLLEAMKPCNEELTEEEVRRNTHGPMLVYTYTNKDLGKCDAPEYFPPIQRVHCKEEKFEIANLRVPINKLVKGAYPGITMDLYYPGFPTMKHLKYTGELKQARVKVFEQPSRFESMIVKIQHDKINPDDFPVELLGTSVFVGWPHLMEGRLYAISNSRIKYVSRGEANQYNSEDVKDGVFKEEASMAIERYKHRLGIEVGDVKILFHVQIMTGRKYVFSPNGRLTLEKQFAEMTANYPIQTVVTNIETYDANKTLFRDVQDVFPEGVICFSLGNPHYGAQGIVTDSKEAHKTGRIKVCLSSMEEPNFSSVRRLKDDLLRSYKTAYNAASQLGMSHFLYSRITGSIFVETPDGEGGFKNVNVGLNLKFNKRNQETPGYTKRIDTTWYYTDKCTQLVREYSENFGQLFKYCAEQGGNDNIKVEVLFGDDWEEKIKKVQVWLRGLPTHNIERQQCGSQVTEPEVVEEIEKIIDNYCISDNSRSKRIQMSVKPSFLYKPELQSGTLPPDPKMQVELFDRIVNTRSGFSVPFGLKGTIIAIAESPSGNERDTMYDVVFDKPFQDGLQLNCSPGRGYKLPRTAFIDISYGKRVLDKRTGKDVASSSTKQENPWDRNKGQKFFNMNNSAREIPDQYPNYPKKVASQEKTQGSAFVPFNSNLRGFPNEVDSSQHESKKETPQIPETSAIKHYKAASSQANEPDTKHYKVTAIDVSELIPEQIRMKQSDKSATLPENGENKAKENGTKTKDRSVSGKDWYKPFSGFAKDDADQLKNPKESKNTTEQGMPSFDLIKEPDMLGLFLSKEVRERETPVERETTRPPNRVNTDFLKRILKIDKIPTKTETEPVTAPEVCPNVSFDMLAEKVANVPASIRLLTYYQSNGLGVPQYLYVPLENKCKANIVLTDGEVVLGDLADSKQDAIENVANKVLQLLMKKVPTITEKAVSDQNLPIPPKNWVKSKEIELVPQDEALNAVLQNPFVPTQVIKNNNKSTDGSLQDVVVKQENVSSANGNAKQDKGETGANGSNQNKKTKPKTKIAANFLNKFR